MKFPNPYRQPFHQWPAEVLAAYQTFPQSGGKTLPICEHTEAAWREWCAKTPKHLWPGWVLEYAEIKRLKAEGSASRPGSEEKSHK